MTTIVDYATGVLEHLEVVRTEVDSARQVLDRLATGTVRAERTLVEADILCARAYAVDPDMVAAQLQHLREDVGRVGNRCVRLAADSQQAVEHLTRAAGAAKAATEFLSGLDVACTTTVGRVAAAGLEAHLQGAHDLFTVGGPLLHSVTDHLNAAVRRAHTLAFEPGQQEALRVSQVIWLAQDRLQAAASAVRHVDTHLELAAWRLNDAAREAEHLRNELQLLGEDRGNAAVPARHPAPSEGVNTPDACSGVAAERRLPPRLPGASPGQAPPR